jgi:hypothetical protein
VGDGANRVTTGLFWGWGGGTLMRINLSETILSVVWRLSRQSRIGKQGGQPIASPDGTAAISG